MGTETQEAEEPPETPLRICVLHADPHDPENEAPYAELDPDAGSSGSLTLVPEFYADPVHKIQKVFLRKASATREVLKLAGKHDVFINLCDGSWDETTPGTITSLPLVRSYKNYVGIEVVRCLQQLNLAYTGADVDFYDPSRTAMKMACASVGVKFPRYALARSREELEDVLAEFDLEFPVICKHYASYSSLGITKKSRVTNMAELTAEANRFMTEHAGVLIEEFVEGPEFTVLVASNADDELNPIVYTPVRCSFPPGETFKHYDLKWVDYEGIQWQPVLEPELRARLEELSRKMFVAVKGRGYGRLDIRQDQATGDLLVLEINPNCGIFYPKDAWGSADFILGLDPSASHRAFLDNQIKFALKEQARLRQPYKVKQLPRSRNILGAFGLFADRPIKSGELVVPGEELPINLVSKRRLAEWTSPKKDWVDDYCWALNEGTYAMWDPVPDRWRPINHSCDPNVWLVGLDTVARRDIPRGAELTMDYATFMDRLEPFDCLCGAVTCRGRITGNDCCDPRVAVLYGDHVSAHIRGRQAKAGLTGLGLGLGRDPFS